MTNLQFAMKPISPLRRWCFLKITVRMGRRLTLSFALLLSAGSLVHHAVAQNQQPSTSRSVELSRMFRSDPAMRDSQILSTQETEDDLFAVSSPGDDDIGVQQMLKERERVKHWLVFGEVGGYYTSNVALLNQFVEDDAFLVTGFGVSYQHEIGGSLLLTGAVRQQFFRYDEFSVLDFDSFNVSAQLTYILREFYEVAFFVRYNYNILTQPTLSDEFFNNHTVTFGAQKSFALSRAHYWYTGADAVLSWADPSIAGRNEYGFFLGYGAQLTRALNASFFYRFGYFDYEAGGRHDINNSITAALAYTFFEHFTISGSVSSTWNNSNIDVFDYDVVTPGGALQAQLRF